jgi:hypothetical protein
MKILQFKIFIADPGFRIGSSYFYADPGSRILLFLSRILDPGSSYFYRRSGIPDPLILSRIYRESGSSPWKIDMIKIFLRKKKVVKDTK